MTPRRVGRSARRIRSPDAEPCIGRAETGIKWQCPGDQRATVRSAPGAGIETACFAPERGYILCGEMRDQALYEPVIVKDRAATAERWGGWIISLSLHVALFALLLNLNVRRPSDPPAGGEPPPVRIVFNDPEPPPTPLPPPDQSLRSLSESVRRTSSGAAESEEPESRRRADAESRKRGESPDAPPEGNPDSEDPSADANADTIQMMPEPEAVPAETDPIERNFTDPLPELTDPSADPVRNVELRRREEELLRDLQQRSRRGELTPRGSDGERREEIAMRLKEIEIDQNAKRWLTTTEGQTEGVIRSLDTMGVPQSLAEEVLGTYGIRIYMDVMDGRGSTLKFLNEARTSEGTYLNDVGRGMYQIFSIPQSAVARMMRMELRELARRGMDPARTRVLEVEYGIIRVPDGYDLGITKFNAVPNVIEEPR